MALTELHLEQCHEKSGKGLGRLAVVLSKNRITQKQEKISKIYKHRFEEEPLANLTMCELSG